MESAIVNLKAHQVLEDDFNESLTPLGNVRSCFISRFSLGCP